jgi:hypothetical protein
MVFQESEMTEMKGAEDTGLNVVHSEPLIRGEIFSVERAAVRAIDRARTKPVRTSLGTAGKFLDISFVEKCQDLGLQIF